MSTLARFLPCLALLCLVLTACGSSGVQATPPATEVITTKPTFEKEGSLTHLIVTDGKHRHRLVWSAAPDDGTFYPVKLDPAKTYTFTFSARSRRMPSGLDLAKVELEGRTIYDVAVCEVHQLRMDLKDVDIIYGLVHPPEGAPTWKDEKRLFPHRQEVSYGGCILPPDHAESEKLYVCVECKKAYEAWKAKHPKK